MSVSCIARHGAPIQRIHQLFIQRILQQISSCIQDPARRSAGADARRCPSSLSSMAGREEGMLVDVHASALALRARQLAYGMNRSRTT